MTLRTKGLAPIVTGLTKIGTGGARSLGGLSGLQKTQLKLFNNDQTPLATTTVKLASPAGTAIRLHWGDGNFDDLVCDSALKTLTHDYAGVGAYEIGISGDIDRLLQLQCFSQAFISGDIANLSALTSLTYLYLGITSVDGDIANLGALTSLTALILHYTSVDGDIANLSALTSLTLLSLSTTSVTGNIANLSALTSLTHLYLFTTGVTGDIANLGALTSLTRLSLYSTSVTGDIANLSALTSLTRLYLYTTGVTGDIANLSALTSLTLLYLNNTSVTYSTFVHPAGWKDCNIQCQDCAWSTGEVDQIMIDHDAITVGAYTSNLTINGTNAARTNPGAGENARASLDGKGKAVAVN